MLRCFGMLIILMISQSMLIRLSYADNVIDDPELLYLLPSEHNTILDTKLTIKHTFHNIQELVAQLNKLNTITARVDNRSILAPIPVRVFIADGTLEELLNSTSHKLGYSWRVNQDNEIIFSGLSQETDSSNTITKKLLASKLANSLWLIDPADRTLHNTLSHWSKLAGWQLIWDVNADYPITARWAVHGTFEQAINQVLQSSQHLEMPLRATMHDSNKVLEIYSPHDME